MIDPSTWHFAKNFFLLCLSLIILPFTTPAIVAAFILSKLTFSHVGNETSASADPKTVLVTGVSMAKGLAIARLLHRQGHKVIAADYNGLSPGRVSNAINAFYVLPRPAPIERTSLSEHVQDTYVRRLSEIIEAEGVHLWICVSDVAAAIQDAQAKELIEERTKARVIQLDQQAVETLHDKAKFIELARSLRLDTPDTRAIDSPQSLIQYLSERGGLSLRPGGARYLVKPIAVNDIARFDMPILPLASEKETLRRIGLIPFGQEVPFIVQEFVQGQEFCSHALVIQGRVRAFVACPSADVLMQYTALPRDSLLSQKMLAFTETVVNSGGLAWTGHISFDFIVRSDHFTCKQQGSTIDILPIECNPRVHTAVLLFNQTPEIVDEYLSVLDSAVRPDSLPLYPRQPQKYYWIGQDFVEQILMPFFELLHGDMDFGKFHESIGIFFHRVLYWKDGTFEAWDPWPWWWLYHVQWPTQFVKFLFHGRWQKLNVSTGKMFEVL